MCNLYSVTKGQTAIVSLSRAMRDCKVNLRPPSRVILDSMAPIVRNASDGVRELTMARWGMPSTQRSIFEAAAKRAEKMEAKGKPVRFNALLRTEPDGGTMNIRDIKSLHWRRWLGVEHRCVVPFTSFSEFNKMAGGNVWFALDRSRPLAFFAGIWTTWTSIRRIRERKTTNELFGVLATSSNNVVGAIRRKAMPVILTAPDEIEIWMTAPADEALKLQRPLADRSLEIVARGVPQDG